MKQLLCTMVLYKYNQILLKHISIKVRILTYFLGTALAGIHKYNDAIIMYDRCIKINPNFSEAFY